MEVPEAVRVWVEKNDREEFMHHISSYRFPLSEKNHQLQELWNAVVETVPPPTGPVPGLSTVGDDVPEFEQWAEQHTIRWRDTGQELSVEEITLLRYALQYTVIHWH